MNSEYQTSESYALQCDSSDPLREYRQQFYIPKTKEGQDVIYFCGNSLGLQPKSARGYLEQEMHDWELLGVEGHFSAKNPWMPYHEFLTQQTARLVGAKPIEVVTMNTLTVNLHLMMVSFYRPTPKRYKILIEKGAFPSDQYAVQSQIRFHGFSPKEAFLEISPRLGESCLRSEDIESVLEQHGHSIALILLGGVNYYTGQAFEMDRITKKGHQQGCLVGFDLAHAAGNLILALHDWEVDFAVWCSYKYLNGGPGCLGGCFVHEKYANKPDIPRFSGWWGHQQKTRFQMGPEFHLTPGAEGWQISNPPILPMATLRASLEIFDQAGMSRLRQKADRLTGYLEFLLNQKPQSHVSLITPIDPKQRGCQLSIAVRSRGKELFQHLQNHHIRCDWREPDVVRVAPVPLYNTFLEVYQFNQAFQSFPSF